jgi:hypothetical protein
MMTSVLIEWRWMHAAVAATVLILRMLAQAQAPTPLPETTVAPPPAARGKSTISMMKEENKGKGATGITTAAPHVADCWGRGNSRLLRRRGGTKTVPAV